MVLDWAGSTCLPSYRIPQTDDIGVGTITFIWCEYSLVLNIEIYFYIFKVYFMLLNNMKKMTSLLVYFM